MSADSPSSKKVEKPSDFQLVESQKELIHLLSEAANAFSTVTIWTKNQEFQFKSRMKGFDQSKKVLIFATPSTVETDQFKHSLEGQNTTQTYFCVLHPRANLYFVADLRSIQSSGMAFDLPKSMHKVQRRENVRYAIPIGKVMPLHFQDPVFPEKTLRKNILDISAGGLSFLTASTDESLFVTGLTLENLEFTVKGRKINVSGQVRYAKTHASTQEKLSLKIGVQFTMMKAADSDEISAYVNEEIRKYYMGML